MKFLAVTLLLSINVALILLVELIAPTLSLISGARSVDEARGSSSCFRIAIKSTGVKLVTVTRAAPIVGAVTFGSAGDDGLKFDSFVWPGNAFHLVDRLNRQRYADCLDACGYSALVVISHELVYPVDDY